MACETKVVSDRREELGSAIVFHHVCDRLLSFVGGVGRIIPMRIPHDRDALTAQTLTVVSAHPRPVLDRCVVCHTMARYSPWKSPGYSCSLRETMTSQPLSVRLS